MHAVRKKVLIVNNVLYFRYHGKFLVMLPYAMNPTVSCEMGSERRERGRIMGALNCGSIYGTYIVLTSNANARHMPNK